MGLIVLWKDLKSYHGGLRPKSYGSLLSAQKKTPLEKLMGTPDFPAPSVLLRIHVHSSSLSSPRPAGATLRCFQMEVYFTDGLNLIHSIFLLSLLPSGSGLRFTVTPRIHFILVSIRRGGYNSERPSPASSRRRKGRLVFLFPQPWTDCLKMKDTAC